MSLFQGWFKLPINENSKKDQSTPKAEFVLLASRSMLNQLHTNKRWFIDATFQCCPPGFYQMLNVITYTVLVMRCGTLFNTKIMTNSGVKLRCILTHKHILSLHQYCAIFFEFYLMIYIAL